VRQSRRRRGLGVVLPIVMGLLVVLLLGASLQLFSTGSSLHQAARDAGGAVAEQLAISATEEALHRWQSLVNDPDSKLFVDLRRKLFEGDEPSFDVTEYCRPVVLPELLQASAHAPFYRHVTFEHLSVVVRIPTRPDVDVDADAAVPVGHQFVDIDCAVSLRCGDVTIWRRICTRRRYGVTFVSNYKPFDQLTFAIIRSGFLECYPGVIGDVSAVIDNVNRVGPFLREIARNLADRTQRLTMRPVFVPVGPPPPITGAAAQALARALEIEREADPGFDGRLDSMSSDELGWFQWSLVLAGPDGNLDRTVPDETTSFDVQWPTLPRSILQRDVPGPTSIVFSVDPVVNLIEYDYDKRLVTDLQPKLDDAGEAASSYNQVLARMLGRSPEPLTADELNQLARTADTAGRRLDRVVRTAVDVLNDITRHVNGHTRAGFNTDVLQSYLRESSRRLQNLAYHLETADDLERLQTSLPAFNGHLNYNGRRRLTLHLPEWRGLTIISGPYTNADVAPLTVDVLRTASSDRDFVVLNHANLHLRGETVEASVFAADRLYFEGRPSIRGNLILNYLRPRDQRSPDEDLAGTVTFDERCRTGDYLKRPRDEHGRVEGPLDLGHVSLGHYTVGMAPRWQQRVVFRSPEAKGQPFDEESS